MREETLLIITPGFPANEDDSTCLPSQQLLVRAFNRNFPALRIVIISLEYPFVKSDYNWYGNRVISINGWKKGKRNKLATLYAAWSRLLELKRKNQVVGILSFWCTQCAFVGKYFARMHGLLHYSWILGQDAKKNNSWVKWIKPRGSELVAMSHFLAGEFQKNHQVRPGHIIPNGVDTTLFEQTSGERGTDILGVGSLIPLKRFDLFIEIVNELRTEFPGLRAVIAGNGPELKRLNSMISHYGLERHIELVGEKPHAATLQLMQNARILLHPSGYEGFSTVCLEALYAGAEVISFCNPKEHWVKHWHIVTTKEDMIRLTRELLTEVRAPYERVLVHSIDDAAKRFMALFR